MHRRTLLLLAVAHLSLSLKDEEKKLIVDKHNIYRSQTDPSAADMQRLSWDTSLEELAKSYAAQCIWDHNKNRGYIGENLFLTSGPVLDLDFGLADWHQEKDYYNFTTTVCQEGQMCGHYTQMVWAGTQRVGCGQNFCEKIEGFDEPNIYLLVCNYEPPGNIEGSAPYTEGSPCSECPRKHVCRESLCEISRELEEASTVLDTEGLKPPHETSTTASVRSAEKDREQKETSSAQTTQNASPSVTHKMMEDASPHQKMEDASPSVTQKMMEDTSPHQIMEDASPHQRMEDASPPATPQMMADVSPPATPQMMADVSPSITPQMMNDASPPITPPILEDASPPTTPQMMADVSPSITPQMMNDASPPITPPILEDTSPPTTPHIADASPPATPQMIADASPPITPQMKEDASPPVTPQMKEDASQSITPQMKEDASPPITPQMKEDASPPITPQMKEDASPPITPQMMEDISRRATPQMMADAIPPQTMGYASPSLSKAKASTSFSVEESSVLILTDPTFSSLVSLASHTTSPFIDQGQVETSMSLYTTRPASSSIWPSLPSHQFSETDISKQKSTTETLSTKRPSPPNHTTEQKEVSSLVITTTRQYSPVTERQAPVSSDKPSVEIDKDQQTSSSRSVTESPPLRPQSPMSSAKTDKDQKLPKKQQPSPTKRPPSQGHKPPISKVDKDKGKNKKYINSAMSPEKTKLRPAASSQSFKGDFQSDTSDKTFFGKHVSKAHLPRYCRYPCFHNSLTFPVVAPLYRTKFVSPVWGQGKKWWPLYNSVKKHPRTEWPYKTVGYKRGVYSLYLTQAGASQNGGDNLTAPGKGLNGQTRI